MVSRNLLFILFPRRYSHPLEKSNMKKLLIPLVILSLGTVSLQAQAIFADSMDYPAGNITANSSGKWIRHSGGGNDSLEVNHRYEVNESRTDDVHRWFDPVNT